MGDVFNEQIVKRRQTAKDSAIKFCLVLLVILIAVVMIFVNAAFMPIVVAAAAFGAWFLMSYLNVEYEYAFTNGEIDIDIIYNKSRRKRLMTVKVKEFEIMAPTDSTEHAHAFQVAQEVVDCSSGTDSNAAYACLLSHNSKRVKLIIEPNEKMLKAIAGTMSRRKLHLRPGVVFVL